jgi:hypothetical protein
LTVSVSKPRGLLPSPEIVVAIVIGIASSAAWDAMKALWKKIQSGGGKVDVRPADLRVIARVFIQSKGEDPSAFSIRLERDRVVLESEGHVKYTIDAELNTEI